MSNTRKATSADREAKVEAQEAQKAEANGTVRSFEFDGYSYELQEGQPSPRALEYIARWALDDENLAVVLAVKEMLGAEQWGAWSQRHRSGQISEFAMELNRVAGGN